LPVDPRLHEQRELARSELHAIEAEGQALVQPVPDEGSEQILGFGAAG
jgi:hypothetical protein